MRESAQHSAVVDENRGDISTSSVGEAVSVTALKLICGEVETYLQVCEHERLRNCAELAGDPAERPIGLLA